MEIKYYYMCYEQVIPSHICDALLNVIKKSKPELGKIAGNSINKNIRKSHVTFDSAWWVYRWTHPYIHKANKEAGWNFQWDYSENYQLTEYRPGEYYKWHKDMFIEPYGDNNSKYLTGKTRKLSTVVALNDSKEYAGGELEFYNHSMLTKPWHETCKGMTKKGSIIVFPSFIWHRVTPVKKGIRYSLTNWHVGNPFK
jgi:PKHD-type hydroxylase